VAKPSRKKRKAAKAKAKAKNPLGTLGAWPSDGSLSTANAKALVAQWQKLTGQGIPAPQFANSNHTPPLQLAQFASSSNTLPVKHRAPVPMGIRSNEEVRDRLTGQEYGSAGYDVVGASPELACALFARSLKFHAPIVDLIASACYTETEVDAEPLMIERHWAWVVMLDRKDDADKDAPVIALVAATQGAPRAVDEHGQPLADILYTLDEFTRGEYDERPGHQSLPISSGVQAVLPDQSVQITVRPQAGAFRPKRFFISSAGTPGGSADWIVEDLRIGNRSQFAQAGNLPGDMFASGAIDAYVSFETCQTAMDITVVVRYVGTSPEGAIFYGALVGTAVDYYQANTRVTYHATLAAAIINAPRPLHVELAGQLNIPVPTLPQDDPTKLEGTAAV
jgi:hypothetical protein